jgi:hypothetical protein
LPISVFPTPASPSSSSGRPSTIIKQSAIASTSFNDGYSKEALEVARAPPGLAQSAARVAGLLPGGARHGGRTDYVDCFATAHSPASLAALEDELARL